MPAKTKYKDTSIIVERAVWGDIMSLGMVFPISITIGFFLGRWLGRFFGYPKTGIVVGLICGIATGFLELYRVTVRLNSLHEINNNSNDSYGDDHKSLE